MSKVFKVLSLSFLLCLSLVVAPFHISANASLSAPFVGYNIYNYDYDTDTYVTSYDLDLESSGFKMTCTNMLSSGGCNTYSQTSNEDITGTLSLHGSTGVHTNRIIKIDLILDNYYVGYVRLTHSGTTKNYYVNGNKLEIYTTDTSQTITINSYELSLNSSDHWTFPIESFNVISHLFNQGFGALGFDQYNSYFYPLFDSTSSTGTIINSNIYSAGFYLVMIVPSGISNASTFNNYFTINTDITMTEFTTLFVSSAYRICKLKFERNSESETHINITTNQNHAMFRFCVIFGRVVRDDYPISTDFALNFGLSNEYLNAIYTLANGTDSSASSQSDLAQSTDDLTQSSNQLVTQEDAFNSDMNSALQNVNTDFNFGSNFGSKFIASADWVKTQYDRLTGNTPFGSVISFSLLIGLALLLVGKVFK